MVLPKGKCQPLNFGKLKGKHEMKYQLNDGRIMSEDELKVLYCSMTPTRYKDIEFYFWLSFVVEKGTIKEISN